MKRDMAREAFAGVAGGNGADFGSDFASATFGADLSSYFGASAPAAPTGKSTTTTTSSIVSAPTAPKVTTTTTVTKSVVVAPKAPVLPSVSKLTPVHPALQAPSSIKSPFAMSVASALKVQPLTAPSGSISSRLTHSVPTSPFARIAPPPLAAPRTGVSAFAPPAPFVPSAPTGRYAPGFVNKAVHAAVRTATIPAPSPYIAPPTGRYNQGDSYRALQRTAERRALVNSLTPETSIWNRLNPFNWFRDGRRTSAVGYRPSEVGYRRSSYDQGDSYRALQRAAEGRAYADSVTPESGYYPRRYAAPFASVSAFSPPAIVPSDDSYKPDTYSQSQGVTSGSTPSEFDNPSFIPPTIRSDSSGQHSDDPDDSATYGSQSDLSGTADSYANPDLISPQDSVAGDSDVSFAQNYGQSPTRHRHWSHHRYDQQPVHSAYQTGYMPQQFTFAPPEMPVAPRWSASNPPPPPTGYNNGY